MHWVYGTDDSVVTNINTFRAGSSLEAALRESNRRQLLDTNRIFLSRDRGRGIECSIWNIAADRCEVVLQPNQAYHGGLAFSAKGNRLLIGQSGYKVQYWDLTSGKMNREIGAPNKSEDADTTIHALGFLPDEKSCWSGSRNIIQFWDLETGMAGKRFALAQGHYVTALSPDGTKAASFASGKAGDATTIWALSTGKEIVEIVGPGLTSLCFTPDNRFVLVAAKNVISKYDLETGKRVQRFTLPEWREDRFPPSVTFSPNGDRAVDTGNGLWLLWDIPNEKLLRVLVAWKPTVPPAVLKRLEELLAHDDEAIRRAAAQDLARLGRVAVPLLIDALKHKDPFVRVYAAAGLSRADESAKAHLAWKDALKSQDIKLRREAAAYFEWSLEDMPLQLEALKDSDPFVRRIPLRRLLRATRVPPIAREIRDTLRDLLKDLDPVVQCYAAAALWESYDLSFNEKALPVDKKTATVLVACGIGALSAEDPDVRRIAAGVIYEIGYRDAAPLRPHTDLFEKELNNTNPWARGMAAYSLAVLRIKHKSLVPTLAKILEASDTENLLATCCMDALGMIGDEAGPAIPLIVARIECCGDPWGALERIGSAAVPSLVSILKGNRSEHAIMAARILGRMGPAAKEAVPGLLHVIENPRKGFQDLPTNAASALGGIGIEAHAAIPVLLKQIQDAKNDAQYRYWCVNALSKMGPKAKTAVPALREWLKAAPKPPKGDEASVHDEVQRAIDVLERLEEK